MDMIRESFNHGWAVGPNTGFFNMVPGEPPKQVTLPYDAMIMQQRNAHAASEYKKGFFPDGSYDYVKKFFVPEEYKEKRVTFEFEGVYMNAMVYINGDLAGQRPYGYSNFYIKADRFLKYAVDRVTARGGRVANLEVTLICERPKIGPLRDAMRARIAEISGVDISRVAVKATTSEKRGFTGREEGIAATASATIRLPWAMQDRSL